MSKFLKLSAGWCSPCKLMDAQFSRLNLSGVIENIDIESRRDIAAKYRVRSIPTLIKLDDNGDELDRVSGSLTDAKILEFMA